MYRIKDCLGISQNLIHQGILFLFFFFQGVVFQQSNGSLNAQCNFWTQKADFGGTARFGAVGFSIGSKGYIGTGYDAGFSPLQDFWEYDPTGNTWTQRADFGGTARFDAVGFSIGNKGYIGTGDNDFGTLFQDFWEYDPTSNTWTQKANFGGTGRSQAVGFSIGSKGYIGTGDDCFGCGKNDFWEYDPTGNMWTQKADFGGTARYDAVGFSIVSKGYIGTGYEFITGVIYQDFWEYDPTSNTWTQKTDFGGTARTKAVGFSIGSKGYIGTGDDCFGCGKNDFWEYDPTGNMWTQKADFGGTARYDAVGFSIVSKGYIGTGYDGANKQDFWEYDSSAVELSSLSLVKTDENCTDANDGTTTVSVTGGTAPYSYQWNDPSSQTAATATGLAAGTYIVVVIDINACSINDSITIYEPSTLTISIIKTDTICGEPYGTATALASGGTPPYSFQWSTGDNISGIDSLATGQYTIAVTDSNGCIINDTINIDNLPWQPIPICLITVDSTSTKNVIVWEKPVTTGIDSFKIYRDIVGTYTHIGSVLYDSLSVFKDNTLGVNPQITSYRYKISVLDTCGNESVLSDFHKTIHLQVIPGIPPAMELSWDDYEGFTFTYYRILRDTTGLGNWEAIDSVSFGINSRTDPIPPQTGNLNYLIEVVAPSVCVATKQKNWNSSKSNTSTSVTGINEHSTEDSQIRVYPNPNNGQFVLELDLDQENEQLQIIVRNILGQVVYEKNLDNPDPLVKLNLDLGSKEEGLYTVQAITSSGTYTIKILLKHTYD